MEPGTRPLLCTKPHRSCAKTSGFKNAWGLLPPLHSWPLLLQHRVGLPSRSSVCSKIAFCSLQFGEGTESSKRSRWRDVASNIFMQAFTPFVPGYILKYSRNQQPLGLVLLFSNLQGGCWELLSHLKSWTSHPLADATFRVRNVVISTWSPNMILTDRWS